MAIGLNGQAVKPLQVQVVEDGNGNRKLFDDPIKVDPEIMSAVRIAANKMEQTDGCNSLLVIPRFEDTVDLYRGTSTPNEAQFVKLENLGRLQQQRENAQSMAQRVSDRKLGQISYFA